MTHLLDENYYKALQYDETHNLSHNDKTQSVNNNMILNIQQLSDYINNTVQIPQLVKTPKQRKYIRQMPFYIDISTEPSEYFNQIQVILSIHQNIPFLLKKPRTIYWNNQIFQIKGRKNRFQCSNCDATIKYCDQAKCIYTAEKLNHKSTSCIKLDYKYHLINKLLLSELKTNIHNEPCIKLITPAIHYARILKKYKYKFPFMDLRGFPPFANIKSNLYKQKSNTSNLTSNNVSEYFNKKFNTTFQQFCNSACMRKEYKKNIKYWINGHSLLFTNIQLLQIFFGALAVGGDGTFNIIPQFRSENGGRTKYHSQVFKLYAFYQYQTKNGNIRTVSYLVGVGLLDGKNANIYKWMYECIFEYGLDNGFISTLNIKQYVCDFEEAQRIGFRYVFDGETGIIISGEEFHFKQALCGNIVKKDLSKFYIQRKDSINYDRNFRIHIEALYNLLHIHPSTVQSIAIKICQSLWNYTKNSWNCNYGIKCVLKYIVYFLYGYCELSKDDIIRELKCKGPQITFVRKRRPKKIESIISWNINNKPVTSSNSIEVNNKHHRIRLGYYPKIDDLINGFLELFDENIKMFNYNQQQKILPNQQQSKGLIKKKKFLKTHKDDIMNFQQYKSFSAELTRIKYQIRGKDINKWLINGPQETTNTMRISNHSFNDIIKISDQNVADNSIHVFNQIDVRDLNDEDYIPKKILHKKQITKQVNRYNFRKRKRKCVEKLQNTHYQPYVVYGSDSDEEENWNLNMRNKNKYNNKKQKIS